MRANYLAPQSRLFIFSDGPRDESAREGVEQVRQYIHQVDGFASIEIIERDRNYGCAKNIIDGITQVVNEFGRIIIVEDDILTSPYFLSYMNEALELYKDDDRVGTVNGYISPILAANNPPENFFTREVAIWGWGTWSRVWKYYNYDAGQLLAQIQAAGLEDKYNYGLKSKPRSNNLKAQAAGKVGTWDYQLDATLCLHGKLSLRSGKAFSNNIGFDGTGIHCGTADYGKINVQLADEYEPLKKIPVEVDERMYKVYKKSITPPSLLYRAVRKIWRILTGRNKKS